MPSYLPQQYIHSVQKKTSPIRYKYYPFPSIFGCVAYRFRKQTYRHELTRTHRRVHIQRPRYADSPAARNARVAQNPRRTSDKKSEQKKLPHCCCTRLRYLASGFGGECHVLFVGSRASLSVSRSIRKLSRRAPCGWHLYQSRSTSCPPTCAARSAARGSTCARATERVQGTGYRLVTALGRRRVSGDVSPLIRAEYAFGFRGVLGLYRDASW